MCAVAVQVGASPGTVPVGAGGSELAEKPSVGPTIDGKLPAQRTTGQPSLPFFCIPLVSVPILWFAVFRDRRRPTIGMPARSQHPAGTEHAADSGKWGFATVTVRQHASQNSSTVKPARRIRERSVPCRMVDLFGTESDGAPRFLRMMWLPRWRSICQPKCSNTRTTCAADTNGTGGIGI